MYNGPNAWTVSPASTSPRTVIPATLVGPLMMCTLIGDADKVIEIADFVLDRFLAGYRTRR